MQRQRRDALLLRAAAGVVRDADLELAGLLEAVARRTATGKYGAGDSVRVAAVAVAARLTTTTEARR